MDEARQRRSHIALRRDHAGGARGWPGAGDRECSELSEREPNQRGHPVATETDRNSSATFRSPSTRLSQPSSRFKLAKMRLTFLTSFALLRIAQGASPLAGGNAGTCEMRLDGTFGGPVTRLTPPAAIPQFLEGTGRAGS